jgi:cyclic beta-1,2-glucan synthetase
VEWTLGVTRNVAGRHVVTQIDEGTGAIFARNTYPGDLGCRVAFFDSRPAFVAHTGDRTEFLGREGSHARPPALQREGLSGRVGASFDPCAALQMSIALPPGEERTIVFVLGQAEDRARARALVTRYREPGAVDQELLLVRQRWDELLSTIQIETPDRGLNLVVNRWLLYQVVSARLWGRTGFYQSGGAYGFRDQLQDITSLVYAQPRIARAHILRAAARQFVEGDAQHWWHPPLGRGVRTRFADDYLWLPFCAAHYVEVTGDATLWEEEVPFIEARPLAPDEQEAYLLPTVSPHSASLWDHCLRALDRSTPTGQHGLPLMGCGDWNDGMSRVGVGGRGESVWMAWFLAMTMRRFAALCDARNDPSRADRYRGHADAITSATEQHAWDGEWYMRAFFDDGSPLGTHHDEECRIDSLAQSWSVISHAGDSARSRRAIESVEKHLVDQENRIYPLLAPPFDRTPHDPGYIKGYVPGVRENGGQYTHAAAWLVLAETLLGRGDRAGAMLHDLVPANLSPERAEHYAIEPYVVAGDITAAPPNTGRGGWSWYTGSAAWIYRVTVESLLGFSLRGDRLTIEPCIPAAWSGFSMAYRRGTARYDIRVENPDHVERGVVAVTLDGAPIEGAVTVVDDGATHVVRVTMGATSRA